MNHSASHFYEFGPFRFDAGEQQLWRGGEEITLTPKAFGVLLLLVKNSGHAVPKEDFMREVWPDTIVEEKNLTDNISILRQVLGDSPQEQRYIKTVPRRGYRFVAEVREVSDETISVVDHTKTRIVIEEDEDSDALPLANENPALALGPQPLPKARFRLLPTLLVSVLILGVSIGIAIYLRRTPPAPVATIKSIAVLPFKPLVAGNGDPALELGMTDALITRLSNLRQVRVRPTSAIRNYSNLEQDSVAAGRELTVDCVLEGNIQRVGDRLRVTVRLLRVNDGSLLLAEKFDEKFTDIFAVQDSISARVATAVVPKLTTEEAVRFAKRNTTNPEAYNLYLTGRFFWNKMTANDLQEAIKYYRRAIVLDQSYAPAHAGVADAYNMLGIWQFLPDHEAFREARAAALKALEIDDSLSEAHTALAYVNFRHDWEWQAAETEFKRAIELNPNYPIARQFYAEFLIVSGRFEAALNELNRAQELDPLSLYPRLQAAIRLYFMRRYDEAIGLLRELIRMDSGYTIAYDLMWACYREKGMHTESVTAQLESLRLSGFTEDELKGARAVFESSGVKGFQRRQIELWKTHAGKFHLAPIFIAMNHALLGEKDDALKWLETARDARHGWLTELKADPVWDSLRNESRFIKLVEQVKIPE